MSLATILQIVPSREARRIFDSSDLKVVGSQSFVAAAFGILSGRRLLRFMESAKRAIRTPVIEEAGKKSSERFCPAEASSFRQTARAGYSRNAVVSGVLSRSW